MIEAPKLLENASRTVLTKPTESDGGDLSMNANGKDFEVELMAQEQTENTAEKVPVPVRLEIAKIL